MRLFEMKEIEGAMETNAIPGRLRRKGEEGRPLAEDAEQPTALLMDSQATIEAAVRDILVSLGEDPDRDGLKATPARVARALKEMLNGYNQNLQSIISGAMFDVEVGAEEMVIVSDIPYNSMCEHHMLPFTGRVHVGYLPKDKVVGLSKIPRIVDMFAQRLQVQERMTNEVADALETGVDAAGVIVVVEGEHSCTALRGVKKHGVNMVTTARRGAFRQNAALREEFYHLIGKK
jgi:GTP cyclohydrolase I